MIKINRSTIEQIAWYIVALVLVAAMAVGIILYNQNRQIQQSIQLAQVSRDAQLQAVKKNQDALFCVINLAFSGHKATQAEVNACNK